MPFLDILNWYVYLFTLARYPAIFNIRPDIRQDKSGIRSVTGTQKRQDYPVHPFTLPVIFFLDCNMVPVTLLINNFFWYCTGTLWKKQNTENSVQYYYGLFSKQYITPSYFF
jgi:hypothetical protein